MVLLIAEDEHDTLEYLEKVIDWKSIGINRILTAQNGKEALNVLENSHVDILLSDIEMPLVDGLSLIKTVNQNYDQIDCIILTAFREFDYIREALRNSVFDYILKPINEDELLKVIGRLVHQKINPHDSRENSEAIQRADSFIIENFDKNPSLDDICSAAGLSKTYFCNLYKKEKDMSVWNYITVLKIEKGKEYLHDFNLRVYEIAHLLGIENPSYFNRIFKSHVGVTPKEYRSSLNKHMS